MHRSTSISRWFFITAVTFGIAGQQVSAQVPRAAVTNRAPRFLFSPSLARDTFEPVDVNRVPILFRRISVNFDGATLETALRSISKEAGLKLAYSKYVVSLDRPVRLKASDITVAAALTEVLLDADVDIVLSSSNQAALIRRTSVGDPKRTGSITGVVTDAKTHEPISGASVSLSGTRLGANTRDDGRYRIVDVSAGTYTLTAKRIGFAPASHSVTIADNEAITTDLTLEKSATTLEQVVTTGTLVPTEVKALPTPITVITAEDIERLHPRRYDDLIRLAVPGAVVYESEGEGGGATPSVDISIRGASSLGSSNNPKIYVDGIEVADNIRLSIDPSNIERMEVLRGPQAAAIYGSDAMGGVIQIFTKRGEDAGRRPQIDASAAVGRIESPFDGYSGALRQEYAAGVSARTGQASYRFGVGYRQTGEYMPLFHERTPSAQAGVHFDQNPLTLDLSARFEQRDIENGFDTRLPLIYPTASSVPPYRRGQHRFDTYGLKVAYQSTPPWQHDITAGIDSWSGVTRQYKPRYTTPTDTLLDFEQTPERKFTVAYHTAVKAAISRDISATITAGADHYTYNSSSLYTAGALTTDPLHVATGEYVEASGTKVTNTGIFAQGQLNVRGSLFLTGSIRTENNSDFGDQFNWPRSTKVGATYVRDIGGTTVKLRASYGQALRPPPFGTKDSMDYGIGCCVQLPNPNLRPETQHGPDAGIDLAFGRQGSFSVTYYDQTAKDFITLVTVDPITFNSQFLNLARVKNKGWEFEGTFTVGAITARGNFAITHSRPEDLGPIPESPRLKVGQQMLTIPEHTAGITLTGSVLRHTSLTGGMVYQGSSLNLDMVAFYRCIGGTGPCDDPTFSYIDKYPGWAKFNVSAEQQLSRTISGYVMVDDATNTGIKRAKYNTYYTLGRTAMFGVRIKY